MNSPPKGDAEQAAADKAESTADITKIARMPRALHGDEWHLLNPLSPDTVSQLVIPAKSRKAGREPGSRKSMIIPNFHWIPDLARLRRPRPE